MMLKNVKDHIKAIWHKPSEMVFWELWEGVLGTMKLVDQSLHQESVLILQKYRGIAFFAI